MNRDNIRYLVSILKFDDIEKQTKILGNAISSIFVKPFHALSPSDEFSPFGPGPE